MTKTPEELAEEFVNQEDTGSDTFAHGLRNGFLAGYQAAKKQYKDAIDTYNNVSKQMLEEAIRIMAPTHEIAENVLGVSNSSNNSNGWISVKDRLPECGEYYLILFRARGDKHSPVQFEITWFDNTWDFPSTLEVTHWMPLPAAPKEAP